MEVAKGNYSVQNEVSDKNDDLDALAMGLNMMIDDLRNNVDLKLQNRKIRKANDELKKAKEKAQESDRLKSAFLANMSHEIRSPMNAIMGFSAVLKKTSDLDEKHKKYFTYIENAGKQLLVLIDDIMDISKIESNQLHIDKKLYDLKDLLQQVFEIIKEDKKLETKPNLRLVLSCDINKDNCLINTDQVRFKQIFINLINNAIKFTDEGFIEVGYSLINQGKGYIVSLYVKDTGIGIPHDQQGSIFERFRQIHADRSQEGTGLGLSITKGLVDLLGGEINVESEPGKGSVFYINFPCLVKHVKDWETENKSKTDASLILSDYLIYIAEDSAISYILLEEILNPHGIKIKHAKNGKELIELIEKQEPDLVLLDIHMPVMDGYETIREIRKRKYTFPVIAETSYAMADERTMILNSGCDGYIAKPINPDELILEIKKHLGRNS